MTDYFNYFAAVTASVLQQGRAAARMSALLAVVGLIIIWLDILLAQLSLPLATALLLLASIGYALIQAYYAARVNLDKLLFCLWAKPIDTVQPLAEQNFVPYQEQLDHPYLKQLDTALIQLKLRKEATPRSLESRALGAIGLLKRQLLALAVQIVCMAAATILAVIN